MVDAGSVITDVNSKIVRSITGINFLNVVGWIFALLLLFGGGYYIYHFYKNKKIFNKRITAFDSIGGEWKPVIRDLAKVIKIGKGGFELLYLKNQKTWKIAYGGRVGKNDYYFFILPDGYWYNGTLLSNILTMDENEGLVPVKTTHSSMRGHYTALEKQIDSLHLEKPKFWDKYGTAVISIGFLVIAGMMLWLNYRQYAIATSNLNSAIEKIADVIKGLGNLASNIQSSAGNSGGLVPA